MSEVEKEFATLSRAFAARKQSSAALAQCPDPQQLFEAASGSLASEQRLNIVDHVSQCAECSQAWRLAVELDARPGGEAEKPKRNVRFSAFAASVVCVVGIAAFLLMPTKQQPVYRDVVDTYTPVSQVTDSLPRDHFLLRWSPGPPGSTYLVRLTTSNLAPLLVVPDVQSPELTVPGSALKNVASGEQLLWQVEAQLPDGQRIASDTFVVTLR
jgi:hypothetical protein